MADSLAKQAVDRFGPEGLREQLLANLTPEQLGALPYVWEVWARPEQLAPEGDWLFWLLLAGRGFGKSRTGAEWCRSQAQAMPGSHGALIGPTAADTRDVMVKALLACSAPTEGIRYEPSKRLISWDNGSTATLYSAEEPDRLRGPQHHWGWCFIAGTKIRTACGEVAIESLRIGDHVLTRTGPRHVVAASAHRATVGRVDFSDGRFLVGTADHPVLTQHGWTNLKDLSAGCNVLTVTNTPTSASPGRTTETDVARFFATDGNGSASTDPFLRAVRSIMPTKTLETTLSRIWSALQPKSIGEYIASLMRCEESLTQFAMRPAPAAGAWSGLLAKTLVSASPASTKPPTTSGAPKDPANIAAWFSSRYGETTAASVVSTWEPIGQDIVHNITVANSPEYFANGILVHNCDELAAWAYADEVWDMLMMTMRQGSRPRVVVSTTPRPVPLIKRLMRDKATALTKGSTFDNAANLSPSFLEAVKSRYEGTRLGRQELYAEVLEDVEGALWTHDLIDKNRSTPHRAPLPALKRVVVAVDPSGSAKRTADEAGIVVAGIGDCSCLGRAELHGFVLEDITGRYSPRDMGQRAIDAYHRYQASRLVAEDNFGGKLVEDLVKLIDPRVSYRAVRATRGKLVRAEPIAALYEQGKVHHVGMHRELEEEMTSYAPLISTESPGRLDALVWALTDLMLGEGKAGFGGVPFKGHGFTFGTPRERDDED